MIELYTIYLCPMPHLEVAKEQLMINVTKTYLPPLNEYIKYLERIWESGWVTNNGELVQELEKQLASYLDVPFVSFVSNGTIALQLALKALDIQGEVITTPFSYVATTNAILWENCKPVFVDIEQNNFCIDPSKIEAAINDQTRAIMAVHVYGYPCDVDCIEEIAKKYNLKVIYDAAHAFGCKFNDVSVLQYGDISTLSFHATKVFHTAEGGAIVSHTPEMAERLNLLKSFGHRYDDYYLPGINAKNTEIHAALGLCVLPHVSDLIERRKTIWNLYFHYLKDLPLRYPQSIEGLTYNYSYFPVVLESEEQLLRITAGLNQENIFPRRYFYPALNKLPFVDGNDCPIAEDLSKRVLCLPLYPDLTETQVQNISRIISKLC